MSRFDAIVIGSGPAGLEAAVNLQIRKKSFLLFGSSNLSTKLEISPKIDNYLGFPGITGRDLQTRYREHLDDMGIALTAQHVNMVYAMGDYFSVTTAADMYEATTVILATGAAPTSLIPGEERLLGNGVGYCATCDAPLYRGKSVAILGWNNDAVLEANFVSEIAEKVYYIPMGQTAGPLNEKIERVGEKPLEIIGETQVEALRTNARDIPVDGVFVLRESLAPVNLVPGIEVKSGFIVADAYMATNLPGCFAAGDCTGKPHQLMRAAGQGQTAALSAAKYIDRLKIQKKTNVVKTAKL